MIHKVFCPWCGHEMIPQRESMGMYYGIDYLYCGGCGASSPRITTDDGNFDGKQAQAIAMAQKRSNDFCYQINYAEKETL